MIAGPPESVSRSISVRPEGAGPSATDKPDLEIHPASFVATDAQHEQYVQTLRHFKLKYEAMLYVIETLASFQQLGVKNPEQSKEMEEVKSLASQARDKMDALLRDPVIK